MANITKISFASSVTRLFARLLLCSMLFAAAPGAHADPARAIAAGRPLKDYPVLTVGVLSAAAEPSATVVRGEPAGLSIDVLRELTGPDVRFDARTYSTMAELIAAACSGDVDILANVSRAADQNGCLTFTVPYSFDQSIMIARTADFAMISREGMRQAVVVIEEGYSLERLIRERFPEAKIRTYREGRQALQAVADHSADVYFGVAPGASRLLDATEFDTLGVVRTQNGELNESRFAVPAGRVALRNDLNERLLKLDSDRLHNIRSASSDKLQSGADVGEPLVLSANERRYLRALQPITVAFDADWAPFSYVDSDGRARGIAVAYLAYLSNALGVTFDRRAYADSSAVSRAFARRDADMILTAEQDPDKLAGGIATEPHDRFPLVIVGRHGQAAVKNLDDLPVRRVSVSERLAADGSLVNLAPKAKFIVVRNLNEALDRVASGEVDAAVGDLAAVDLALSSRFDDQLKILGPAGKSESIGFALRPELAGLVPLVDRALKAMPEAEKQKINVARQAALAQPQSGWSVNALRLLPALIAIGVVLAVTLRAFVLPQREMSRRIETEEALATQLSF